MLVKDALKELYNVAECKDIDVIFFNCKMLIEPGCSISEDEKKYCTNGCYHGIMSGKDFWNKCF